MIKLRIYIVEDDALIAASLMHILVTMGHEICGHAQSYNEAVAQLPNANADLVVLDILLKGEKTGIDVARYINTKLQLPFIIQSSIPSSELLRQAHETEPYAILRKPVSREALQTALMLIPV